MKAQFIHARIAVHNWTTGSVGAGCINSRSGSGPERAPSTSAPIDPRSGEEDTAGDLLHTEQRSTASVRMNQTITSETARVGDQFTTTVVDPVYAGGLEVIPAGSSMVGQVRNVNRASRKAKPARLESTLCPCDYRRNHARHQWRLDRSYERQRKRR